MIDKAILYFVVGYFIHALYRMMYEAYYMRKSEREIDEETNGYDPSQFGFCAYDEDPETGEGLHYHSQRGWLRESELSYTDRIVLNLSAINPYTGNLEPIED